MTSILDPRLIAGFLVVSGILAAGLTGFDFSTANVQSERTYNFYTNAVDDNVNSEISNGLTAYGQNIYLENLNAETVSEGSSELANQGQPYAVFHVGSKRKDLMPGTEEVSIGAWKVSVEEKKTCSYVSRLGNVCGSSIRDIRYQLSLDIPKDQITASVQDVSLTTLEPGVKKVEASFQIQNNWNSVKADTIYAQAFGEKIPLPINEVGQGSSTVSFTTTSDFYDSSKFVVNEQKTTDIQLVFEDPRIPQNQVSGRPDVDGDYRTWESFEPGGSTPDISPGSDYDGVESVATADGACDIKYLRQHGYGADACQTVTGGSAEPISTQNWEFELKDFKTVPRTENFKVQYCGENASYSQSMDRCVIDDELHLRNDICLLTNNYSIVTKTFQPGSYSVSDLDPQPNYFCSKHPGMVTNDGAQTGVTTKPYKSMLDGEGFTVPEGQTYTLFWAVDVRDTGLNTVCEQGTYNATTGSCVSRPGVIHKCSQGVWDAEAGACIVNPDVQPICEQGRFNEELEVCAFEPEKEGECPVGTSIGKNGMCYSQDSAEKLCPGNASMQSGTCIGEDVRYVQESPVASWRQALVNTWNWVIGVVPFT